MSDLFGSPILEVFVGLFLLYFVLSLIASSIREVMATASNARAKTLRRGIDYLLRHSLIAAEVESHPRVLALATPVHQRAPVHDIIPNPEQQAELKEKATNLLDLLRKSTPATGEDQQARKQLMDDLDALNVSIARMGMTNTEVNATTLQREAAQHRQMLATARRVTAGAHSVSERGLEASGGHDNTLTADFAKLAAAFEAAVTRLMASITSFKGDNAPYPSYISDTTFVQVLFETLLNRTSPNGLAGQAIASTQLTLRNLRTAIDQLGRGTASDRELARALRSLIDDSQDPGGRAATRADVQAALQGQTGPEADLIRAVLQALENGATYLRAVEPLPLPLRSPFADALAKGQRWQNVPDGAAAYGVWLTEMQQAVTAEQTLVTNLIAKLTTMQGTGQPLPPEVQGPRDQLKAASTWSTGELQALSDHLGDDLDQPALNALKELLQNQNKAICVPRQKALQALQANAAADPASLFEGGKDWQELEKTFRPLQFRLLLDLASRAGAKADYDTLDAFYQQQLTDTTVSDDDRVLLREAVESRLLQQIAAALQGLQPGPARNALLTRIQGDLDAARQAVQQWYNEAMDRLTGTYKQQTQGRLFWIGLLLAALVGADTLRVVNHLSSDQQFRNTVINAATGPTVTALLANGTGPITDTSVLAGVLGQYSQVLGYGDRPCITPTAVPTQVPIRSAKATPSAVATATPNAPACWSDLQVLSVPDWWRWLLPKVLGIILSAAAISLGAPFWFDLLSRLIPQIGLGSSGPPPDPTATPGTAGKTSGKG